MKRIVAALSLVSLLALAGCKVVEVAEPIKEGQKVRLDPCSVLTQADAEVIIGTAVLPGAVKIGVGEAEGLVDCVYERADGPRYGELVSITVAPTTRGSLVAAYSGRPIAIGKEAEYAVADHEVKVVVLNKLGVQYEVNAAAAARDAESLLDSVKSLTTKIDARIEDKLKSQYKPPTPTSTEVDPCTLLTGPEIEPLVGSPGEDGWTEGVTILRAETFGGRWEGAQSCIYFTTTGRDEEGLVNHANVTVAKAPVTAEEMSRLQGEAETVPRLGAHAFWVNQQLSVAGQGEAHHERSWVTVLTKGGRLFELDVLLHVPGTNEKEHLPENEHKKVSIELAEKVVAKLQ